MGRPLLLLWVAATSLVGTSALAATSSAGPLPASFARRLGYRVSDISSKHHKDCNGFGGCAEVTYSWRGDRPMNSRAPYLYSRLVISHYTFSSRADAMGYADKERDLEDAIARTEPTFRDKAIDLTRAFVIGSTFIRIGVPGTYCLRDLDVVARAVESHLTGNGGEGAYHPRPIAPSKAPRAGLDGSAAP